ncbi:MAG: hypothetical protein K2L42_04505 [Clostridia bacterium]|nr:hypothetical protein [Clostridia bacterium]
MISILKKIYLGDKTDFEKSPNTKEYKNLNNKFEEELKQFMDILPSESFDKLDNLIGLQLMLQGETNLASFKEGFKTGLFLALELCKEEE